MNIRLSKTVSTGRAIGILALALLANSASALELGAANVRSALGERLLIEVPLANAELAGPNCFSATVDGMRMPLGMRKTNQKLLLSTPRIVVEPLLTLTVTVRCANIASIQRQYTLFLDPATRRPVETASLYPVRERPVRAQPRRETPIARPKPTMSPGQGYTVQTGDTVSELAATIAKDGESIWPIVDRIVADNPAAFLDGDANKLIAGSVLMLLGSPGPNGGARADSSADTSADSDLAPITSPDAGTSRQPVAQQATPKVEAMRPASGSETAQILSVLQGDRDTEQAAIAPEETAAQSDSPFKPVEQTPAASDAAASAAAASVVAQGSGISWLTRVLALIGGMALAIGAWIIWQIAAGNAARRRRQQEYSVPLPAAPHFSRQRQPEYSAARPAAYAETVEISPPERSEIEEDYEVAFLDDDDETFSFHSPAPEDEVGDTPKAEPVEVRHTSAPENSEFEVEALESIGMTTIMRGLDEQTQKLLEQDYEAELTHTQRIRRDVAERALKLNAGVYVADEPTEEMHVIDESGEMLAPDELDATLDMHGAKEAEFVATPADDDATMPMSLDLDIDDASVSMVLRQSGDMLDEALKDFDPADDLEEAAPAAKRQA